MNITTKTVAALVYARSDNAADYRWDDKLKGFGVRVYPSGRKSYVITYRNADHRKLFHTLGDTNILTPDQARKRAKLLLAEVERGADPQIERKTRREASTMSEFCQRYLEQYAETKKSASSVKQDKRMIETRVKPELGPLKVHAVTRSDVDRLHHKLRKTPYEANRVLALLSMMMNLAEKWGLRPDGTNPCRHIERFSEPKRERFLSDEELARLGQALRRAEIDSGDAAENPYAVAALRLLALTGCRLSEIITLQWVHVDLDRSVLRLPTSKTGAKVVQLQAAAAELLRGLKRVEGNPYVIVGSEPGTYFRSIHKVWERIRKRAKIDDARIHDLRHTYASVAANQGYSLPIIGKMLGHTQAATTQRYAHLADNPLRDATAAVSEHISTSMAKVVPFQAKRA